MQQAYRILRVVAEAQMIRMVLMPTPSEILLKELCIACTALNSEDSRGVKAVVLDFKSRADFSHAEHESIAADVLQQACEIIRATEVPVLAVVHENLSAAASALVQAADLTLVAQHAVLSVQAMRAVTSTHGERGHSGHVHQTLTGEQALRLGLINWSVPPQNIDTEMLRILDMLREKSAIALRLIKISVHLETEQQHASGQEHTATRLKALKQINEFYLSKVMQTADAAEGLHAFLDKRQPQWKNQ